MRKVAGRALVAESALQRRIMRMTGESRRAISGRSLGREGAGSGGGSGGGVRMQRAAR